MNVNKPLSVAFGDVYLLRVHSQSNSHLASTTAVCSQIVRNEAQVLRIPIDLILGLSDNLSVPCQRVDLAHGAFLSDDGDKRVGLIPRLFPQRRLGIKDRPLFFIA